MSPRHSRSMSRRSRSPIRTSNKHRHSRFDILKQLEKQLPQEPTLGYKFTTAKKVLFKVSLFDLKTGDHLETIDCMPRRDTTVFINLEEDTFLNTTRQVVPVECNKRSKQSVFKGDVPRDIFENVSDILIKFIIPSKNGKSSETRKFKISKS